MKTELHCFRLNYYRGFPLCPRNSEHRAFKDSIALFDYLKRELELINKEWPDFASDCIACKIEYDFGSAFESLGTFYGNGEFYPSSFYDDNPMLCD